MLREKIPGSLGEERVPKGNYEMGKSMCGLTTNAVKWDKHLW